MWDQPGRCSFGFDFLRCLSKCQRFSLRKQIRQQQLMMAAKRIQGPAEADKIAGNQPSALMNKLIERMLAVGPRLAPVDWPRLEVDGPAVKRYMLAVAFHRELLEISTEALQVLVIRKHRDCSSTQKIIVPNREQPHEHRQIAVEGRASEMPIHLMKTREHGAEVFRSDREH